MLLQTVDLSKVDPKGHNLYKLPPMPKFPKTEQEKYWFRSLEQIDLCDGGYDDRTGRLFL